MRGSNIVRVRVALGALFGVLALGALSCASSPPDATGVAASEVTDVRVESSEQGSTILVVGPKNPVFTAFQQSDPDRLIVDLVDVGVGSVPGSVAVHDGVVEEVWLEAMDGWMGDDAQAMARLEVSLAGPADYDVQMREDGLAIQVVSLAAMSAMGDDEWSGDAESEQDPWTAPQADETAGMGEADETAAMPEATPRATVLSRVDARALGNGSLIQLEGNGSVESAVTFVLEDPARLVVDLPEMKSEVAKSQIELGSPQVARVRVGAHADKVRVVVDGGTSAAPFEGRQLIPVPTGLLVALGSGAELDDAVAKAGAVRPALAETEMAPAMDAGETAAADATDETEAAAADEAEAAAADVESIDDSQEWSSAAAGSTPDAPVMIYGVDFDTQGDRDRVVVLGAEAVDYLIYEPDPQTVVLSLTNTVLAPEAAVRIVPEPVGAVSLVTAFDQPEMAKPEVRVVIKRAANLAPEISRRDATLMLDFARSGGLAAVPPAYQQGEAMDSGMQMGESGAATLPAAIDPSPMPDAAGLPLAGLPADAASGAPPASIEILNEGGLMDGKEYVGRRISLDFKEVDIADVLRLIAEVSDLNVIAGDEVKGKVTIRLVDVPWDQALDVILLTKGLGFARVGNVLRIAANDVLAQEEELRLQERRAKEKLEDLVVKLQPVNYADVADVSRMVRELLSDRGTVNTDKRTNTLIIKDIATVIDEATALIKAVDTMTPQVMIEAKIVEASLEFSRELGSLWTFGTNPLTESTLGGRDYVFQQGDDDGIADGLGNQVVFGNPITAGPTGLLGIAASVIDQKFNFEVELQAAEVNGDGKVISSPRIVTLDNSTATIEQGVSIPFQTFENGDAQLEFVDAVLKLDVTPHITADGSIIMKIKVSRNAPDDSVFTLTGSPAIAKNQVQTETLVKDGQTLVLGGIYVVDRATRQSRVPYLSKLPFLGNLFKSDEFSDSRKELLVFVSPRVVMTPGAEAS